MKALLQLHLQLFPGAAQCSTQNGCKDATSRDDINHFLASFIAMHCKHALKQCVSCRLDVLKHHNEDASLSRVWLQ
jgi:hypothetical protein